MENKDFIQAHLHDDVNRLLLQASRYPDIDMPFVAEQILARRQIKEKLPSWYANPEIIFPSRIAAEQCSSELSAAYKQRLIKGERVCDLTGGLGIDCWYFSQKASEVIYTERFQEYCAAAANNFSVLGATNIRISNEDSRTTAETLKTDTFYIDPARRSGSNKRLFALSDCEPDISQLKPLLLDNSQRIIVKISPMADSTETLRLLPETKEIHIVAVKNECKELLFVLEPERKTEAVKLFAINYDTDNREQSFEFTLEEEKSNEIQYVKSLGAYLYEPNAAILKGGAFKTTGIRYGISKLHRHSHLYTSELPVCDFPGRAFRILEIHEFSGKSLKHLGKLFPQANITTRNFPLKVEELRKMSGIRDGGEFYMFATTLANEQKVMIICKK